MTTPFRLDRALLRVSGPDAQTFLQNLLTQNLDALDAVAYAALLSPQGKIIADMLVWSDSDEDETALILETDPARSDDLQRRLSLYKLRANVEIDDVSKDFEILFSRTPFPGSTVDPRRLDGALGWRELSPLPVGWNAYEDGAAAYDAMRLSAGAPDLARDAQPEEVFAGEALLEELNGVDFQKGCFVGQENVSRMKRRATTRKKFCPIVFEGDAIPYGATIKAGDAELGTVRTGAAGRAIVLLRLDRALAARSLSADGRTIRLDPPPWLLLPTPEP